MRPKRSPYAGERCAWLSISPGSTVPFEASTTVPPWRSARCGFDARNRVALDDDVHVLARRAAVEQTSGVDASSASSDGFGVHVSRGTISRSRAGDDVDQTEAGVGLIEHVPRIARPRRRLGELGREAARRTERRPVTRDRHGRQLPVENRHHLRAVGRPHGAGILAHAERLVRHRIRASDPPRRRATRGGSDSCLRGSAWSTA